MTYIFDFDGTIADTLLTALEGYNRIAPWLGCKIIKQSEIEITQNSGLRKILKDNSVSFWKIPIILFFVKRNISQNISNIRMFPGIDNILSKIQSKGRPIYLVSSNSKSNIQQFLFDKNIQHYFEEIYSVQLFFKKSHRVRNIICRHQLKIDNVVYVGDEVRDVELSKELKIKSIAVTWGFSSSESLKIHNPTKLINTPQDFELFIDCFE